MQISSATRRQLSSQNGADDSQKRQMLVKLKQRVMLTHCRWECKLAQPLWKAVWSFLKDLQTELPFDPAIPLMGMYPKEKKRFY